MSKEVFPYYVEISAFETVRRPKRYKVMAPSVEEAQTKAVERLSRWTESKEDEGRTFTGTFNIESVKGT